MLINCERGTFNASKRTNDLYIKNATTNDTSVLHANLKHSVLFLPSNTEDMIIHIVTAKYNIDVV